MIIAARFEDHVAGGTPRAAVDRRGNDGVHAGERGRSLAGVRSVASYGVPGFEGTCSVHIDRRKNDTVRKGHYPALGRSQDPALDIVAQRRKWLRVAGLTVHRCCAKRTRPAARCDVCPPLFPLTRCAQGGVTVVTDRPCSRERLDSLGRRSGGGRLNSLLGHNGAEGRHFGSHRSARRRGGSVPAERSQPGSSGARLLAPHVASSLSRDVRGLRPLTIPPSKNLNLTLAPRSLVSLGTVRPASSDASLSAWGVWWGLFDL